MFKVLIEITVGFLILATLVTQIILPMFTNLELFWLFKSSKEPPPRPPDKPKKATDLNSEVDKLNSDLKMYAAKTKQKIEEADSTIDKLTKAKDDSINNLTS